jgi:hypothetical protein
MYYKEILTTATHGPVLYCMVSQGSTRTGSGLPGAAHAIDIARLLYGPQWVDNHTKTKCICRITFFQIIAKRDVILCWKICQRGMKCIR